MRRRERITVHEVSCAKCGRFLFRTELPDGWGVCPACGWFTRWGETQARKRSQGGAR